MLKSLQRHVWSALLLVMIGWLLYAASGTSSFQNCVSAHEKAASQQNPQENVLLFTASSRVRTICLGHFFYAGRDAIAVVATAFIALFTFTLWRSTQKNADAIIGAERPRVFLSDIKFGRLGGDSQNVEKVPVISLQFKNIGRTSAIITGIRVKITVTPKLPKKPDYGPPCIYFPTGLIIDPNNEWPLPPQIFHEFNPKIHNASGPTAAMVFRQTFWVYGYIAYLDHLGKGRKHGFAHPYVPPEVGSVLSNYPGENFIRGYVKNYTYDT
jgi:hypothetical protein